MKKEHIEALLNKYYQGKTSQGEEETLKEFFRNETDIPEEFEPDKALFCSMEDLNIISAKDRSEEIMGFIQDQTTSNGTKRFTNKKLWVPVAAAASIVLLFSLWFSLNKLDRNNLSKDTYPDPEIAYLETQKALHMVSEKMNSGMQHMEELSALSTATKGLDDFSKFGKTASKLKTPNQKEKSNKNE